MPKVDLLVDFEAKISKLQIYKSWKSSIEVENMLSSKELRHAISHIELSTVPAIWWMTVICLFTPVVANGDTQNPSIPR